MTRYYAGIGSRSTPGDIINLMTHIAICLYQKGFTCRSGGADGADTAFEAGASPKVEVYLPWEGFNGRARGIVCGEDEALRLIAARHHPAWNRLREPVRKLMTRNSAQILGRQPVIDAESEFVICWTVDGTGGGGTGQAIRVAGAHNVPVYDLALFEGRQKVRELCQ